MFTAIFAAALLGGATPATTTTAPTFGDCVWSHVPITDQAEIAMAFRQAKQAGFETHSHEIIDPVADSKRPAFRTAFAQCDATPGIPVDGMEEIGWIESQRFGTAILLKDSLRLTRAQLDAAWSEAPQDVRTCTLADVADGYGVTGFTCADPVAANRWYLARFDLDTPQANPDDRALLLYYVHCRAESAVATHVIQTFEKAHSAG